MGRRLGLLGLALATAVSCTSSEGPKSLGTEVPRCTPGDVRSCEGTSACEVQATQYCVRTGAGWSSCTCDKTQTGADDSGSGGSSANGGSGGGSGDVANSSGGSAATSMGGNVATGTGGSTEGSGGSDVGEAGATASDTGAGGSNGGTGPASSDNTSGNSGGAAGACSAVPVTTASVDLDGNLAYFGGGNDLPTGRYRVSYLDGCFKYHPSYDYSVQAGSEEAVGVYLSTQAGTTLHLLPGTVGRTKSDGAFKEFEDCVDANRKLAPFEFDFGGGPLGVWLLDSGYSDNIAGVDGRNPSWELEQLDACD